MERSASWVIFPHDDSLMELRLAPPVDGHTIPSWATILVSMAHLIWCLTLEILSKTIPRTPSCSHFWN